MGSAFENWNSGGVNKSKKKKKQKSASVANKRKKKSRNVVAQCWMRSIGSKGVAR